MRGKNNLPNYISVFLGIALVMMIGLPDPTHSPYYNPPAYPTATPQSSVALKVLQLNEVEDISAENSSQTNENVNQAERADCETDAVKEYDSESCLSTFEETDTYEMLITYFDQCSSKVAVNQYDCHCNFPLSGETKCSQDPCMATLDKCQLAVEQIYDSCLSLVGRSIDGTSITNSYCSDLHDNSLGKECEAGYLKCQG